jgi:hypothetical protein
VHDNWRIGWVWRAFPDLQAKIALLEAENERLHAVCAERDADLTRAYAEAEAAEAEARRLRTELATAQQDNQRLRNGILAWQIDAAAESLHAGNDNAARARGVRIENRLAQLLNGGG